MANLKANGLHVIAITGRPVGWSEPFALNWPVDAIVAENGATLLQKTHQNSLQANSSLNYTLLKSYRRSSNVRSANYARMQQISQQVLREVPGTPLAQDNTGRETDMAIDHREFTHLSPEKIA